MLLMETEKQKEKRVTKYSTGKKNKCVAGSRRKQHAFCGEHRKKGYKKAPLYTLSKGVVSFHDSQPYFPISKHRLSTVIVLSQTSILMYPMASLSRCPGREEAISRRKNTYHNKPITGNNLSLKNTLQLSDQVYYIGMPI